MTDGRWVSVVHSFRGKGRVKKENQYSIYFKSRRACTEFQKFNNAVTTAFLRLDRGHAQFFVPIHCVAE